jgi:hypothetical protein
VQRAFDGHRAGRSTCGRGRASTSALRTSGWQDGPSWATAFRFRSGRV